MAEHVDIGLSALVRVPEGDEIPKDRDDRYPADTVADCRQMYRCELKDEVRAFQAGWLAGACPPHAAATINAQTGLPPDWCPCVPTADSEQRVVVPYVNASRWLADCPECGTANAVWDELPDMVCLGNGCGLTFKVAWQLPAERAQVVRLLAGWPPQRRSWDAHKGETYDELVLDHARNVGSVELRNGLLLAAGLKLPDDVVSPGEYLDRLRTQRLKAAQAGR